MRDKPETYLFVHVPKTAGTSFRQAAEQVFPGRVARDYGPKSPDTSDLVRKNVYEKLDLQKLFVGLQVGGFAMLAGHFHYKRYASVFPPKRVVFFVREPLSRVLSEYEHARRHHGFEGELMDFAARPRNRNLQWKMLRGLRLVDVGFFGVTERYSESLTLLEERVGWSFPELIRNVNPKRSRLELSYTLRDDVEAQLREWNHRDLAFYANVLARHERGIATIRARGSRHTASGVPRGVLGYYRNGKVFGWAHVPGSRRPQRVQVFVNGKLRGAVVADQLRPDLKTQQIHPTGNAGFVCQLGYLEKGAKISAFIEGFDIELINSPLTID